MNILDFQNADNNYRAYGSYRNQRLKKFGSFQNVSMSQTLDTKQVPVFHFKLGYLYSSADLNGQELHMNYDDSSTEEEPVMLAEGIDMQGNSFKRKIYLNQIDVNHASIVEMTALNVHLKEQGDTEVCSRMNVPLEVLSNRSDLNRKIDFHNYYDTESRNFQGAGFRENADFYKSVLERYLFFQEHKSLLH